MPKLSSRVVEKVVAEGRPETFFQLNFSGFVDAAKADAWMKEKGAAPTAVLLDHDGKVGRAYGAKTTPHMFVIDPKGTRE